MVAKSVPARVCPLGLVPLAPLSAVRGIVCHLSKGFGLSDKMKNAVFVV